MMNTKRGPDHDTLAALRDLDARIDALGAAIWVGAEPTFTDRCSESAEWLHMALGGEKETRASELLRDYSKTIRVVPCSGHSVASTPVKSARAGVSASRPP